jgi:hypothetical protein
MKFHSSYSSMLAPFLLLASAPLGALANDVLKTNGYSSCLSGDSDIKVNKLDIEFDRTTKKIKFDVSGTNAKAQNVMATLKVNAYGKEVYSKTFDPCEGDMKVDQLCPGRLTDIMASLLSLTQRSPRWNLRRKWRAKHPGRIHRTDPFDRFQRPGYRQPGNNAA